MPHAVVPDEVLKAVAEVPDMWSAILEWHRWYRDAGTGKIEITFGNGRVKDIVRYERLAIGEAVKLPGGVEPFCADCAGVMSYRDYGSKLYCERCDRTVTTWEVKAARNYRPVRIAAAS
jgi:hypothetical protein